MKCHLNIFNLLLDLSGNVAQVFGKLNNSSPPFQEVHNKNNKNLLPILLSLYTERDRDRERERERNRDTERDKERERWRETETQRKKENTWRKVEFMADNGVYCPICEDAHPVQDEL